MKQNMVLLVVSIFFCRTTEAQLPFKYDNGAYKAVYLNEAFGLMTKMPNYLLLDVRSPGEYEDTARATYLNLGRLKGSINIPIDSIASHLDELKKHIDQPIFIYCSHSQRSRKVSRLLSDSGFKNIYNINGGMSLVNIINDANFAFKDRIITPHLNYTNITSPDAWHLITTTPNLVIIDIRTPNEFASRDSLAQNNIGHLKNAVNIPQADLVEGKIDLKFPGNSPILVYDLNGYNSMDVVNALRAKGYTRIYSLFDGLEGYIADYRLDERAIAGSVTDPPAYRILDPKAGINLLKKYPDLVILDTRPANEFANHAQMSHANLGRIKGAISVTSLQSLDAAIQNRQKSAPILVYGSNGGLATTICTELLKKGYQNISLLSGGLYNLVWSVANAEGCQDGKPFLVDHEGMY